MTKKELVKIINEIVKKQVQKEINRVFIKEDKNAESVMFAKAKEEEETAKRSEMDKVKILEAMKEKMSERNRIAVWVKSKGIRVTAWTKPEDIIEKLATSKKITLAEMKEFFGKTEDDLKKEKEVKKKKSSKKKKASKFAIKI